MSRPLSGAALDRVLLGRSQRDRVLAFVTEFIAEHGWAPTMQEIADALGLASRSTVQEHLRQLHREGRIVLGGGPRMIRLTSGDIRLRR